MANEAAERKLMERIRQEWGSVIESESEYPPTSPAFIAALIANESGGDPKRSRLEPAVYQHLLSVRAGERPSYAGVKKSDLQDLNLTSIAELATSWGLTQIMGYNMISWGFSPLVLQDGKESIHYTTLLLAAFTSRFKLDMTKDFEQLFRCWNTGSPAGETYDPQYVPLGLLRMRLYEEGASRP